MNLFRLTVLSLIVFFTACSKDVENVSDFDLVCQYFQELEQSDNLMQMSSDQRNSFIFDKININIPNSNAGASWGAVSHAEPEQRYDIFQMGAEEVLGINWQCKAMKSLADSTGANE